MTHERIGHVRFPMSIPRRRNAPTTGGVAAPDERVEKMLDFVNQIKAESQLRALTGTLDPDLRAQALGGYQDCLLIRNKFIELFVTPLTKQPEEIDVDPVTIQVPPKADEPEGATGNEADAIE